jgi:hypothetical protein
MVNVMELNVEKVRDDIGYKTKPKQRVTYQITQERSSCNWKLRMYVKASRDEPGYVKYIGVFEDYFDAEKAGIKAAKLINTNPTKYFR